MFRPPESGTDPNNFDGARGMARHGFRYASHRESDESLSAVRAQDDQVGVPFRGSIDDHGFWVALCNRRRHSRETCIAKSPGRSIHQRLRVVPVFLACDCDFQPRLLTTRMKRIQFDYVEHAHFRLFGLVVRNQCLYRRLGKLGIIDCE